MNNSVLGVGWVKLGAVIPLVLVACTGAAPKPPAEVRVSGQVVWPLGVAKSLPSAGRALNHSSLTLATPPLLVPDWQQPHVSGRVLVLGAAPYGARALTSGLWRLDTPAGSTDADFAAQLLAQGYQVQPDYLYYPQAWGSNPPNDSKYNQQNYLKTIQIPAAWSYLDGINQTAAYQQVVKVAVLDVGFDRYHIDLKNHLAAGWDYCGSAGCVVPDDNIAEDNNPATGHGMASAGLIAAETNNAQGYAGITWGGQTAAYVLPYKVFSTEAGQAISTSSAAVAALNQAVAQGAKVINLSFGAATKKPDPSLQAAILKSYQAGAVLVAAAGNTPDDGIYYPAADPHVLAVGSVDINNAGAVTQLSSFSARGPELDLWAPGNNIHTLGFGDGINQYLEYSGTSLSAPQVAGVAVILRTLAPTLSADEVMAILRQTAQATNPVSEAGIVNALAALQKARDPQLSFIDLQITWTPVKGGDAVTWQMRLLGDTQQWQYSQPKLLAGERYSVQAKIGSVTSCTATVQLNKDEKNPEQTPEQTLNLDIAQANCGLPSL